MHVMLILFALMLHNLKYNLVLSIPIRILGSGNFLLKKANKDFHIPATVENHRNINQQRTNSCAGFTLPQS